MPQDETDVFHHYRVLRRADGSLWELGRGAMGVTYKAIDTNLQAPVALKVINALYLDRESSRDRFVREARAAASLRHRNVASVYHLGNDEQTFFYAMEYIDGETVEQLVQRAGRQPWQTALPIALQVTRALMAAHEKHLVHRDIKPANIMLVHEVGEDEVAVKVIDFGLAKSLVEEGGSVVNLSGSGFLGTPLFASPEQCEEITPDIRSDIYSLGITLWYLLAGRAPFSGSVGKVFSQHLQAPPPWEQLPADVPESVHALLARMLAKERDDRPQTPAELRREIETSLHAAGEAVPSTVHLKKIPPPLDATIELTDTASPANVTLQTVHEFPRREAAASKLPAPVPVTPPPPLPPPLPVLRHSLRRDNLSQSQSTSSRIGSDAGTPPPLERPVEPVLIPSRAGQIRPILFAVGIVAALLLLAWVVKLLLPSHHKDTTFDTVQPTDRPATPGMTNVFTPPAASNPDTGDGDQEKLRSLFALARRSLIRGQWRDAVDAYTQVLTLVPGSLEATNERGSAYHAMGQQDKADADHLRATRLSPTNALEYCQRGNAYGWLHQVDKSIQDSLIGVTTEAHEPYTLLVRGSACMVLEKYDRALQDFDAAVRLDPQSVLALCNRGAVYLSTQKFDRALQDFDAAVRLDPHNLVALNRRGTAYFLLKQYDRAFENFNEVIRLDPRNSYAFMGRGDAYASVQEYDYALQDLNTAIRIDPQMSDAYFTRALVYSHDQQYEKTLADLNEAIRLNPRSAAYYTNRSYAHRLLGQLPEANKDEATARALMKP